MAEIVYSPLAQNDLIAIKEYIRDELLNPDAAERVLRRITESIRRLEKTPRIGEPLSAMIDVAADYQFIVSGNYLAFYRYLDGTCYIHRVLYGKRDFLSILFGEIAATAE